ncbi:lipopolysaccharide/colanic/teichoic acid biosynthesis glycosyltransferase [Lachnospiraceae bacterium PF1-22]|uniref:sugar transferase n=1 Tax=Ohessyouella blattaphilus TaxID=2949333 RepID=UPI003E1FA12B
MRNWDDIPQFMKKEEVKIFYELLSKHKTELVIKRAMDVFIAGILTIILLPLLLALAILIKLDSEGEVFFRQVRVTQYGKRFRIFKFRTMVKEADKMGTMVTTEGDTRITRIGKILRKYRLDEIPQLFNILSGDMTFVGTRPEVEKYVMHYTDEMKATLLMPAGLTSMASIKYKDEEKLLNSNGNVDVDKVYVMEVLPMKMKYNIEALENFSIFNDIKTMFLTVLKVFVDKEGV